MFRNGLEHQDQPAAGRGQIPRHLGLAARGAPGLLALFSEGRQWLDDLVRAGKAIDLGGNDYPSRYTAKAEVLAPWIRKYPPGAILKAEVPVSPDDEGQDRAATGPCPPEEWLIVEVWDTT